MDTVGKHAADRAASLPWIKASQKIAQQSERQQLVARALELVDVPYLHLGRNRAGLDCAGLILLAMKSIAWVEYPEVPPVRMIYRAIAKFAGRIPVEAAGPGDVVLMRFHGEPMHVGMITCRGVVHASQAIGRVVEVDRPENNLDRGIVAYFTIHGVPPWRS